MDNQAAAAPDPAPALYSYIDIMPGDPLPDFATLPCPDADADLADPDSDAPARALAPRLPDEAIVPLRPRGDGWTPRRQRAFIEALADGASVSAAARHVGMSPESAWRLRRRADARGFDAAWEAALERALQRLLPTAIDRALNGTLRERWYHGEKRGEERVYSDRLLVALLHRGSALLGAARARADYRADWSGALDRLGEAPDRPAMAPPPDSAPGLAAHRAAMPEPDSGEPADPLRRARMRALDAQAAALRRHVLTPLPAAPSETPAPPGADPFCEAPPPPVPDLAEPSPQPCSPVSHAGQPHAAPSAQAPATPDRADALVPPEADSPCHASLLPDRDPAEAPPQPIDRITGRTCAAQPDAGRSARAPAAPDGPRRDAPAADRRYAAPPPSDRPRRVSPADPSGTGPMAASPASPNPPSPAPQGATPPSVKPARASPTLGLRFAAAASADAPPAPVNRQARRAAAARARPRPASFVSRPCQF